MIGTSLGPYKIIEQLGSGGVTSPGFADGREFATNLCDAFDVLYREGSERPKMMSIGLRCRLAGRPSRADGVARFLDHVQRHDEVWICSCADIADHWRARFPPS